MIINNYWTIVFIIGIILGGFIIYSCINDKEKVGAIIGCTLGVEFILLVLSLLLCSILYAFSNYKVTEKYSTKTELVALNDYTESKEKFSGGYFLFVGGISGEKSNTYNIRYAYKDNRGVTKIKSEDMNTNDVGFIEDDTRVMETYYEKKVYELNKLGRFLFKNPMNEDEPKLIDYVFHIPKDSITGDIAIDLK